MHPSVQGDCDTLTQTFVDLIWIVLLPARFGLDNQQHGVIGIAELPN